MTPLPAQGQTVNQSKNVTVLKSGTTRTVRRGWTRGCSCSRRLGGEAEGTVTVVPEGTEDLLTFTALYTWLCF